MEKEIHLLSYSFYQGSFHFETLESALNGNLRSIFLPRSSSTFVPILASYNEEIMRKVGLQLEEIWADLSKKPPVDQATEMLKLIQEHEDQFLLLDFSKLA